MIIVQGEDQKSGVEPTPSSQGNDLPPAYSALSIHQSARVDNHPIRQANTSSFRGPVAGFSSDLLGSNLARPNHPTPPSPDNTPSLQKHVSPVLAQEPRARKNASWLSLLPFVSSISAKRVRQSVMSTVSDLVVPPSRVGSKEQKNVHQIFASIAETCAEHKISLSAILQEAFIASHTPMYWAVVNYRQDLLVTLLVHSQSLSVQTISDIRRACLDSSNQALFHALRVCSPPFHGTDGIQVPSLRAASDNLLLGHRPLDEIHITQATDHMFVVFFDIPLWQRRMKAIGQASIEFIASSRMWSVIFFSTDPSPSTLTSGKSRKATNTRTWHIMVSLLESSPPTYLDSRFIVDVLPPLLQESIQARGLRDARSTTFPASRSEQYQSQYYDHDRKAHSGPSRGHVSAPSSSSPTFPPPIHPLRGSPPPITIRFGCGSRKLSRRTGSGESSTPSERPTTKPDTWSDHGVGYTNAAVSWLEEGLGSQLLYDHSPYLLPDGTLRGRLEVRLVKSESSKDCVIC